MTTTFVKATTGSVIGQLWRSLRRIHLTRRDTELLDMTRVRSHSYTSLRDVVAGSLPPPASANSKQLSSYQSMPSIRHVHMRNPLVEKAARAYLATATRTPLETNQNSSGLSFGFSSFLKIVRFPFLSTHRGFSSLFGGFAWFKQFSIKMLEHA